MGATRSPVPDDDTLLGARRVLDDPLKQGSVDEHTMNDFDVLNVFGLGDVLMVHDAFGVRALAQGHPERGAWVDVWARVWMVDARVRVGRHGRELRSAPHPNAPAQHPNW